MAEELVFIEVFITANETIATKSFVSTSGYHRYRRQEKSLFSKVWIDFLSRYKLLSLTITCSRGELNDRYLDFVEWMPTHAKQRFSGGLLRWRHHSDSVAKLDPFTSDLSQLLGTSTSTTSWYAAPKPSKEHNENLSEMNNWSLYFPEDMVSAEYSDRWFQFLNDEEIQRIFQTTNISRSLLHSAAWYGISLRINNHINEKSDQHQLKFEFIISLLLRPSLCDPWLLQKEYNHTSPFIRVQQHHVNNGKNHRKDSLADHNFLSDDTIATEAKDSTCKYTDEDRFIIQRWLKDSRARDFSVRTVVERRSIGYDDYANKISFIRFEETIPDHYDISFDSLVYRVESTESSNSSLGDIPWIKISNLPSFQYSSNNCIYGRIACYRSISFAIFTINDSFSSITFEYKAKKNFMLARTFPPDASYGIVVPPVQAVVHYEHSGVLEQEIWSKSLLLGSIIPDQTMPYNVITLVGTLFAFFLGSLMNILTKKWKS